VGLLGVGRVLLNWKRAFGFLSRSWGLDAKAADSALEKLLDLRKNSDNVAVFNHVAKNGIGPAENCLFFC